jgi:hypothetical protein
MSVAEIYTEELPGFAGEPNEPTQPPIAPTEWDPAYAYYDVAGSALSGYFPRAIREGLFKSLTPAEQVTEVDILLGTPKHIVNLRIDRRTRREYERNQ